MGLLIHGLVGALLGAIFGLLATAVVGFLPSIRDAALRRQRELHELEGQVETAQAAWDAVGEPMPGGGELAALLRPDRAAVEFTGRGSELEALRGWCSSDEAGSVRVISGPGGVGKTRLALKVAAEWEADGGEWRLVAPGEEGHAVGTARGLTSELCVPKTSSMGTADRRREQSFTSWQRPPGGAPGPLAVGYGTASGVRQRPSAWLHCWLHDSSRTHGLKDRLGPV